MVIKFGQQTPNDAKIKAPLTLDYSLHKLTENIEASCHVSKTILWTRESDHVSLDNCQQHLTSGLWSLQGKQIFRN